MHFPEVCDMNMEDILTAQSVCIEIKKRYRWSGQLKVTTVKDNKITKIFESTERFTNENLQDQTIVVYEVPKSRSGRYMAVNLFDLETETFFGFPFLMEKPTESISYVELHNKLQLFGFLAQKSERVLGTKLDNWWNGREAQLDVDNEELEEVSSEPEDVSFEPNEVSFDVHKLVLIARSEVFRAMLTSPTSKESINNQLTITDIQPNIVEKMLQFIYGDNCTDIDFYAIELFMAADKYFLDGLKTLSVDAICRKRLPKLRQALILAAFGEFYNEDDLVESAIDQILPRLTAIVQTEDWKNFSKIHPALAIKILTKAVPKQ